MYLAYTQLHDELADLLRTGIGGTFTGKGILMGITSLGRLCVCVGIVCVCVHECVCMCVREREREIKPTCKYV